MESIQESHINFYIHCLEIRIVLLEDSQIFGWLGATIRNNFLYAMEGIRIDELNLSLREFIGSITITESHSLYPELKNGFPAPYVLSMNSHNRTDQRRNKLNKGEIISFSLTLTANISKYTVYFLEAIKKMCKRGIGNPIHPVLLLDIFEKSRTDETNLLLAGDNFMATELIYPVYFENFLQKKSRTEDKLVKIIFETPVNLFKPAKKGAGVLSYQNKLNGFPSFYQFIRSLSNRLIKLVTLYCIPDDAETAGNVFNELDNFTEEALFFILRSADIRFIKIEGAIQKEKEGIMTFSGYTGELIFEGNINKYLPILLFMQYLGVGDNTVYGMGQYRIKNISGGYNLRG